MPTKKKITPEEAVADLKSRKHAISKADASRIVKKFKTQNNKVAKAAKSADSFTDTSIVFPDFLSYNKKALTKILNKKECIGLRMYPALNDKNEFTLVIVGIDEQNNNIGASEELTAAPKKTVAKKTADIVAKPVTGLNDDILDEGQASPPYPPPSGGL